MSKIVVPLRVRECLAQALILMVTDVTSNLTNGILVSWLMGSFLIIM